MFSLLFGVGFGEFVWHAVVREKFTLKFAKRYGLGIAGINFLVSMGSGAIASLEIAIVMSLYAIVIFDLRESKNARKT